MSTLPPSETNQPQYPQAPHSRGAGRVILWITSGCVALAILLIVICAGLIKSIIKGSSQDKKEAEIIVSAYLDDMKTHHFDDSLRYCSSYFTSKISHDVYIRAMKDQSNRFGELKSYSIVIWSVKYNNTSYIGALTELSITYKCIYQKCNTKEVFILTRGFKGPLQISNREVNFYNLKQ